MSEPPKDPQVAIAEAEKVKAEAESAKIKARKEEREEREAAEPAAKAAREADLRQKVAEAEKARAAAQREQISALVPDLKDVNRGELEDKSDKPMFEAALAQRALDRAATALAERVSQELTDDWRLLITSDAELLTSDATYHDVVAGFDQLTNAAEEVLREPEAPTEPEAKLASGHELRVLGFLASAPALVPVASAVASAIPALLGVFSAQRTLKSADVGSNDLAAAAAVAGALNTEGDGGRLTHDGFRLLPTAGVHRRHAELVGLRRRLTALKLTLEAEKAQADPRAASRIAVRLGLVDSVSSAIDTFNASVVAVPQCGTRSPLTVAAAREQLHATGSNDPHAFTHVLLLKSEGGSVHQTIDDKPFLMSDKLSIAAAASITWALLALGANAIVDAGTAGGTATAYGEIGDRLTIGFDDALELTDA